MATGHIKLGTLTEKDAATMRSYMVRDPLALRRELANPFVARIDAESEYTSLDNWSEWGQKDWQAGVGQTDTKTGGGFLYGEIESRVPRQLILPGSSTFYNAGLNAFGTHPLGLCRQYPVSTDTYVELSVAQGEKVAIRTQDTYNTPPPPYPYALTKIGWLLKAGAAGNQYKTYVETDNSGTPSGTKLDSREVTVTINETIPLFYWWIDELDGEALDIPAATKDYWVIFEATSGSFTLLCSTTSYTGAVAQFYDGSWAAMSNTFPYFHTNQYGYASYAGGVAEYIVPKSAFNLWDGSNLLPKAVSYGDDGAANYYLGATSPGYPSFSTVAAAADAATYWQTALFNSEQYVPLNSTAWWGTTTGYDVTYGAHGFCTAGPYLYRTINNDIYYSADASTWSGPFEICADGVNITGMAELDSNLYVTTEDGLYLFAPGNIAVGLTRWASISATNGKGVTEFQGALYIPVGGRLMRYDTSGSLVDIWFTRDEDLSQLRTGQILSLYPTNNFLLALVGNDSTSSRCTIWAYTGQGWHFIGSLPNYDDWHVISYNYDDSACYAWSTQGVTASFRIDDATLNPYNDSSQVYMPDGWLETDKFYGGYVTLDKDWESVTIVGENLSANVDVDIYWQDEDSTGWELLGTADADVEEITWPTATRPASRWLKLAIKVNTNNADSSPNIEAIVVKYHVNVTDRNRWSPEIVVSNNQEMFDGMNTQTAAQMITHLDSLITNTPPIGYQDIDGTQYIVKVEGGDRVPYEVEWLRQSSTLSVKYLYRISLVEL